MGGSSSSRAEGCQGGCERRIEVIVKMQKNVGRGEVRFRGGGESGRGGGGVFSERSYCENAKTNEGVGSRSGRWRGMVRVMVNKKLKL